MTSFHVDAHALDGAASHITRTIESIHTDIASLTGQLRGLDGSWSGPAALAFAGVVDEWMAASTRVTESLSDIGTALRQIQAHYLETEQANVRILGR
ncbi:MAG: WXG100 family type VII secretion target [Microbacteriaceae bacterium]|nr:WXG100 family type VII secretion target [Microbacteriaceae bacterium]